MFILTEHEKKELQALFPKAAPGLIEKSNYDEIIEFLDEETVAAFDENDEPTDLSNRIERLLDDINWKVFHPNEEYFSLSFAINRLP